MNMGQIYSKKNGSGLDMCVSIYKSVVNMRGIIQNVVPMWRAFQNCKGQLNWDFCKIAVISLKIPTAAVKSRFIRLRILAAGDTLRN